MHRFRKKLRILLLLPLFFIAGSSFANNQTQYDFQTWLNATFTGYVNKENHSWQYLKYWLEGQERIGDDSTHFSQTLARMAFGYAFKPNVSLWLGYAWVRTGEPYTSNPFNENRIWQQLLWVTPIKHATFTSRTRTEQRFLANNQEVAYRIRQLVKISLPIAQLDKFSWVSSDELFWHKNDFIGRNGQGFDQNRFFIGLAYALSKSASLEGGYMNQYVRRYSVPDIANNNVSINLLVNF